jgi:hypothetical protein
MFTQRALPSGKRQAISLTVRRRKQRKHQDKVLYTLTQHSLVGVGTRSLPCARGSRGRLAAASTCIGAHVYYHRMLVAVSLLTDLAILPKLVGLTPVAQRSPSICRGRVLGQPINGN